jgi:hypothetical protein
MQGRDGNMLVRTLISEGLIRWEVAGREQDGFGRVIATVDDYAMARRFLLKVLGEASGAAVPASVREAYQAVFACAVDLGTSPDTMTWPNLTQLAAKLGIDKSAASRRVAKAKELGLLVDQRERRGFPSRIALAAQMPEDLEVLPGVERIRGCPPPA